MWIIYWKFRIMNKSPHVIVHSGLLALILPTLLMLSSCTPNRHVNWTFGSNMTFTANYYGDPPEQYLYCQKKSIQYPKITPNSPLIGRVEEKNEPIIIGKPNQEKSDEVLAFQLAEIAYEVLQDEVGIEKPFLYVLLFPVERLSACRVKVPLVSRPGFSIGIPVSDDQLNPKHAYALIHLMVHEATEAFMVYRNIGYGTNLYSGDIRNRWIGDGMANLAASFAIDQAAQEGLNIASVGYPKNLLQMYEKGRKTLSVNNWQYGEPGKGRYAASEYLCYRWYEAARKQNHEHPIVEFVIWVRKFPKGPRHDQVLAWLERTSGIDLAHEIKGIPIDEILQYKNKRWKDRGWELPLKAEQFE